MTQLVLPSQASLESGTDIFKGISQVDTKLNSGLQSVAECWTQVTSPGPWLETGHVDLSLYWYHCYWKYFLIVIIIIFLVSNLICGDYLCLQTFVIAMKCLTCLYSIYISWIWLPTIFDFMSWIRLLEDILFTFTLKNKSGSLLLLPHLCRLDQILVWRIT